VYYVREKPFETTHAAPLRLRQLETDSSLALHVGKALAYKRLDGRLNSFTSFRAGLEIGHLNRFSKLLSLFLGDFSLSSHIALVANEDLRAVSIRFFAQFRDPKLIDSYVSGEVLSKVFLSVRSNTTSTPSAFL